MTAAVAERAVPRSDLAICRRRLYGDSGGRWLIVDGPAGWTPPSQVDGLTLFGDLHTVLCLAQQVLRQHGHPPLAGLARLLGMNKNTLGNSLDREKIPSVPDAGWSVLVRYLIDPDSVVVPTVPMGRPWPGTALAGAS